MRKITDYNKDKLISKEEAVKQKKFYELNINSDKIRVSLIEGLSKIHFSNNLYDGINQGSKRWWVLERRKFDYNKFYSRNNHKIFLRKDIDKHELEWGKKVSDFYSIIENGYIETSSIGKEVKSPSKYILNKYYDNDRILTKEEVKKIGITENNEPLYYKIIIDEQGNEVDVKCNVNFDDIKYELDCKKFTHRWWVFKRIRFDFGYKEYPLSRKQERDDMKGVIYKFSNLSCVEDRSFFDIHEESWSRYVESIFELSTKKNNEISIDEQIKYNQKILYGIPSDEFYSLILHYPMILITNTPLYLYQEIMIYIINTMLKDKRIKTTLNIPVPDLVLKIKKQINNLVHKESVSESRITLDVLKSIVHNNPNSVKSFLGYFFYNSVRFGMVRKQYINSFLGLLNQFEIEKIKVYNNSNSLQEQLAMFDVNTSLISQLDEYDKKYDDYCKQKGLYIL